MSYNSRNSTDEEGKAPKISLLFILLLSLHHCVLRADGCVAIGLVNDTQRLILVDCCVEGFFGISLQDGKDASCETDALLVVE